MSLPATFQGAIQEYEEAMKLFLFIFLKLDCIFIFFTSGVSTDPEGGLKCHLKALPFFKLIEAGRLLKSDIFSSILFFSVMWEEAL